ncbi:hypothetical protein IY145_24470 [Methylosinus sp. H3A]|nr:hypothetical protein [Methylosinus sp. H3A]
MDRERGVGGAQSKDMPLALFRDNAADAKPLYDPSGADTLDERKQQAFADKTLVEPSRHLADAWAARSTGR